MSCYDVFEEMALHKTELYALRRLTSAILDGTTEITIIICSVKPERCEKALENISKTIGVNYEAFVFDNRELNWGICKVYNQCAEKANSPIVCFMHEDVSIETKNWGKIIIDFIEKTPDCGIVGFAGGLEVEKNFIWWWYGAKRMNVNDELTDKKDAYWKFNYKNHHYINPQNEACAQVLCVDGIFQLVKKTVWSEIKYDEKSYNGFHFYDVDFSLAVAQKYKNYVLLNMDVFHDSSGSIDKEYIKNMFIFQNKWNKKLPCYLDSSFNKPSKSKIIRSELRQMIEICELCKKNRIKTGKFLKQIGNMNGILMIPVFYIYYWNKKITGKIINLLEKI
ncbi:hypothetical protein FACS1894182_02850 [Bacteroidia bacterium]|nr:hypothetical protein FACS1894182_02850 [Bacteroidia bacterium]